MHPQGAAVAIARGCGQCLNFNPTLVVILMMRRGLTWLRSTRVAFLFPLDQHIAKHQIFCATPTMSLFTPRDELVLHGRVCLN